jgi:mycobactin peptide synthetase MbtE
LPRPAVTTSGHTEPTRTDTEHALAAVFADLLSTSQVGRFDDFFALGGDSILSVQLASRARAVGLSVNPRMVFENPTVEKLAAAVDAAEASVDGGSADVVPETRFEPMSTSGLSATDLAAVTELWSKSRGSAP